MDKAIFITGTSTGFGRTAAETLARRGYTVTVFQQAGSTGV